MAKDRAFKVFLALPYYDVIDNLAKMVDAFQTDDEITKAVSRYVMLLYARRQARRQGRNLQDDKHWRSKLRWRLYSKHQKETESLPFTPSALNRHIQRSIFVTGLCKLSAKQFRPQLPRLQEHGWEINQDWLSPIRTDELLAPEYCIEMVSCSCKKLKCVAGRCSYICRDNHLPCTDLCNCVDCENGDDMNSDIIIDMIENDEEDSNNFENDNVDN